MRRRILHVAGGQRGSARNRSSRVLAWLPRGTRDAVTARPRPCGATSTSSATCSATSSSSRRARAARRRRARAAAGARGAGERARGGARAAAGHRALADERPGDGRARAFAFYFLLANVAEQYHRVRRRREPRPGGRPARESLATPFAQPSERRASMPPAAGRHAGDSLEPVLTAHPTEAARRTFLQSQLRLGGCSRSSRARPADSGAPARCARRGDHRRCGRRTRCARSARAWSTRSATGSGSSSTR